MQTTFKTAQQHLIKLFSFGIIVFCIACSNPQNATNGSRGDGAEEGGETPPDPQNGGEGSSNIADVPGITLEENTGLDQAADEIADRTPVIRDGGLPNGDDFVMPGTIAEGRTNTLNPRIQQPVAGASTPNLNGLFTDLTVENVPFTPAPVYRRISLFGIADPANPIVRTAVATFRKNTAICENYVDVRFTLSVRRRDFNLQSGLTEFALLGSRETAGRVTNANFGSFELESEDCTTATTPPLCSLTYHRRQEFMCGANDVASWSQYSISVERARQTTPSIACGCDYPPYLLNQAEVAACIQNGQTACPFDQPMCVEGFCTAVYPTTLADVNTPASILNTRSR